MSDFSLVCLWLAVAIQFTWWIYELFRTDDPINIDTTPITKPKRYRQKPLDASYEYFDKPPKPKNPPGYTTVGGYDYETDRLKEQMRRLFKGSSKGGNVLVTPTRWEYKEVSDPFPITPLYETEAWQYMSEDAKERYVDDMVKPKRILL